MEEKLRNDIQKVKLLREALLGTINFVVVLILESNYKQIISMKSFPEEMGNELYLSHGS